ncbi:hypothetical protein C2G38_2153677 [Gigaspora rosea]|uniref:Uncharacterized protein n=1 Tax=Gigaspora rosea TaxID=44941 RepID=A0A397WCX0_9GLOM|nr:hypothetical protein C2G38_2153677 [Gigaspora rosea]
MCHTTTSSRNGTQYKIPANYLVQTSWGRNKSHHMVECEIEYEQDGLIFIIRFEGNSYQYVLKSKKSPIAVANDYLQSPSLKPFNSLSESMKTKRSRAFSVHLGNTFGHEVPKFFNLLDQPTLQEIKFNVQDKNYVINYNNDDKENSERSHVPFMEAIDRGPISHHAYRKLAAIQHELPRAYEISDIRKTLTKK